MTGKLLNIMLLDSAHIQESEAEWANQKGKRAGRVEVEPLYTIEDAKRTLSYVDTYEYGEIVSLFDGVKLRFADAGHLLGSAFAELWITEGTQTKKLVFSGDIGNLNQPIINDPSTITEADFVVMESTYGLREHEGDHGYTEALAQQLDATFARGGNVIIPAFAVGRTQELLYFIREIKERGLVTSLPDFPVYVDSPLANEATQIFQDDLTGYMDKEAMALIRDGVSFLSFPGLNLCSTVDESKALNDSRFPKVIISASGMCDAGRIRHHLKHNLWRPECTVIFVGFQAEGTFGRFLLEGATKVKMFGEEINVAARIVNFHGLSSHAGRSHLLEWAQAYEPPPQHIFVVHGENESAEGFAHELTSLGLSAHAPFLLEEYDLLRNTVSRPGIPRPEKAFKPVRTSPAFYELLSSAEQLLETIKDSSGYANKELRSMNEQVKKLLEQWARW